MCKICDEIHKRQMNDNAYPKIAEILEGLKKKDVKEMKCVKCRSCGQPRETIDGSELKRLRVEHKLSFRQLAKEVQLSIGYLFDIENNRRLAPLKLVNYWKRKINPGGGKDGMYL